MSDERFDRIESLLTQLISNVGGVRADMNDFRQEMSEFRSEVNQRLDKLDGQVAVMNQRLDHQRTRLAKAEEDIYLLQAAKN